MGVTAISGPHVVYGITQTSSGGTTEYNEERGPSLFDMGNGVLDPRPAYSYRPGSPVGTDIVGFLNGRAVVDFAPFTASSNLFMGTSVSGQPVSGTAITLYTSRAAAGAIPTTIIAPETGAAVTVIAIDSTAMLLPFGQSGATTVNVWNPAAGTGRTIVAASPTSGITTVTVVGRDMYGYKMTETISASSSDATRIYWTGAKAFKYLSTVYVTTAAAGGAASTGLAVGTLDVYGFPLLVTYGKVYDTYGMSAGTSAVVTQSAVLATLGTTTTATGTTGDVRGTYATSAAANGTLRVQMSQLITPAMVSAASSDTSALFGVTQFSSL